MWFVLAVLVFGCANGSTWIVSVKTGGMDGAGTDAHVYIRLHGVYGHTSAVELDDSNNNFERSQVDTFAITVNDVGTLTSLEVWHDNSGRHSGWYLDEITLSERYSTVSYLFPCHNWLSLSDGDHQLSRTLYPV